MGEFSHADGLPEEAGSEVTPRRPYAIGMEVEPPSRTPPATRPDGEPWAPYYGVRFSRRTRWVISLTLLLPVLFLVLVAAVQMLLGSGTARALGVILLLPLVVGLPLVWWAMRDMWRPHR
jgi:hypothetical protein